MSASWELVMMEASGSLDGSKSGGKRIAALRMMRMIVLGEVLGAYL